MTRDDLIKLIWSSGVTVAGWACLQIIKAYREAQKKKREERETEIALVMQLKADVVGMQGLLGKMQEDREEEKREMEERLRSMKADINQILGWLLNKAK